VTDFAIVAGIGEVCYAKSGELSIAYEVIGDGPRDIVFVPGIIVGSTEKSAAMGDRRWHEVIESYYALVRRAVDRFRGCEVSTEGDGFIARFDGPARAVSCARAVCEGVQGLGIDIRAGVHTGEIELRGNEISGLAVHIGARVIALAEDGEVLVSRTVKDLVVGSGIEFSDRGTQDLKGVPDAWQLFA
jgi:class 3 adenylate cyclase